VALQVFAAGLAVSVSTVWSWLIVQFEFGFHGSAHGYSVIGQPATDNTIACPGAADFAVV
jgi:hypothetical protein